jgi:hypothetical protein
MLAAVTAGAEHRWISGQPQADNDGCRFDGGAPSRGWVAPVRATLVTLVSLAFLLGWSAGLLTVWKSWQLFHASRWIMVSGAGYVTLMLIPTMCGFVCARLASRLASRGWGGAPLRALALGIGGLVAGLLAI